MNRTKTGIDLPCYESNHIVSDNESLPDDNSDKDPDYELPLTNDSDTYAPSTMKKK